jgi:dihydrofolate reductase
MRNVIFQMLTSVDGYFEGPNHELDWHKVGADWNTYVFELFAEMDTMLFGRRTYEMMAAYWPTSTNDPIAENMNSLPKIVFSKTLKSADWTNSRIATDAAAEIRKLKQEQGKNMVIFGSSDLAVSLMRENLIDDFRIVVSPIVLGNGKPLFHGLNDRHKLKFLKTQTFQSGHVMLYYQPDRIA